MKIVRVHWFLRGKVSMVLLFLWGGLLPCWVGAQHKTSEQKRNTHGGTVLEEVTAIGSRISNLSIEKLPYEVKSFSQAEIRKSFGVGMAEFLQSNANLFVSGNPGSFSGTQVQMGGLSSAYIQLVEDGQPLVGREAGELNLQRVPSFFINKMEIVKGTMTTIYGDNALAGVISISTLPTHQNKIDVATSLHSLGGRYTVDVGANMLVRKKHRFNVSFSHEGFGGYKIDPHAFLNTIDPYASFSGRLHWVTELDHKHTFRFIARGYTSKADGNYGDKITQGHNKTTIGDYNLSVEWKYKILSNKLDFKVNIGKGGYASKLDIKGQGFQLATEQRLETWRPSVLLRWVNMTGGDFALGSDIDWQALYSDRYKAGSVYSNVAIYTQQEWSNAHWTLMGGIRLDMPHGFNAQFSPKISTQYTPNAQWKFNLSVGLGAKTPDLRQRFMVFNHTPMGYYVLGSDIVKNELQQTFHLSKQAVDSLNFVPLDVQRSFSVQLGFQHKIRNNHLIKVWGFYNDITSYISTQQVLLYHGLKIFSYKNIGGVYTAGLDVDYSWQINPTHKFSLMYGFTIAREKDAEKKFMEGNVIAADKEGHRYRLNADSYIGVMNVPQHMATLSFYGAVKNWFQYQASFRLQLISGFQDKNGTTYFDSPSESAPPIYNLDIGLSRNFSFSFPSSWQWKKQNTLSIQLGAKNILNQVAVDYLPTVAGINVYLKCALSIL